ncbi:MAG: hypothetical protein ACR2NP_20705, partial [Pirellulaceae bacterium]
MLTIIRIAMVACVFMWAPAITSIAQTENTNEPVSFGERTQLGSIQPAFINEASGLAASRRYPGMYWVHNDNGRHPGLFLIDAAGRLQATVQLAGASFQDWEDLAAVTLNGQHHLIVADCGDNSLRRDSCRLFVLSEPERELEQEAVIEATISDVETLSFRYPDGARDCESVAVDNTGTVFLLTKQHAPEHPRAAWYTLTLNPQNPHEVQTANRLESGFDEPLVTGMDFAPNGRWCVVRSYGT